MLATTWVQIIKAVLFAVRCQLYGLMVMKHVGFSFNNLFSEAMAVPRRCRHHETGRTGERSDLRALWVWD